MTQHERAAWLHAMEAQVFARAAARGVVPMGVSGGRIRYGRFWLDVIPVSGANDRNVEIFVRADGTGFVEAQPFNFTLDDDAMDAGDRIADRILGL